MDNIHDTNLNITSLRFVRLVFGLTCSPAILNAILRRHFTQYSCIYVDDLASGSDNTASALELAKKIKTLLSEGGFNMRKWLSNSKELMTELQDDPLFSEDPQQPSNPPNLSTEED